MTSPHEKLAEFLEALRALQDLSIVAVRSGNLTRRHRERLVKNDFLQEVMKGWYIPAHPDEATGERTAWYASVWARGYQVPFSEDYLNKDPDYPIQNYAS